MVDNISFFKTHYDPQHGWMLNNLPVKSSGGTEVEINDNKYNITPGLQKVFTDQSYETAISMNDTEKLVFRDILLKLNIMIINVQKVVYQVVIDIIEMNLIMMSEKFQY